MPKNTGLGKGLDALFGNSLAEEEKKQDNEVVEKLKIIEVRRS